MNKITANGLKIYAENDIYKKHMSAHTDVKMADIAEAISKITAANYNGQFGMVTVDLDRPIGYDHCVTITDDSATLLYRKGRKGKTPCLVDERGELTSLITLGICKDDDERQTLFTAFYGALAPKEPWDCSTESERAESESFWKNHALCVDSEAIDWERSKGGEY